MGDSNLKIYGKIYDIVDKKLKVNNQELPLNKDIFLSTIGDNGDSIDLVKLKDVPRNEFLDVMYMKMLGRTSGINAKKRYSNIGYLEDSEWKRQVVEGIIWLDEGRAKRGIVHNNIFN